MIDLEQHTSRDKPSTAHTFDYIALRAKPGLISCEDLATALVMRMPWDQSKGPSGQGALIPGQLVLHIYIFGTVTKCANDIHSVHILKHCVHVLYTYIGIR